MSTAGANPSTPRARRVASLLVVALALVTTSVVSVAIDRATQGRTASGEHEGHDEHGDEHGDQHDGHGEDEVHDEGRKDGDGERSLRPSEHRTHVDVATVKLTPAQQENAKLTMEVAGPGRVDETLTLQGEVAFDADRVAHVTPRSSGAVREVLAGLGDVVRKGQVLAILDSREVAAMQQELLAARARRELTEANFRRIEPLFTDGITSEKDFLAAKQALAEAKIDESSAAQKLAAGAGPRTSGSGLSLLAPLDGTIVEKHVTIGEVVAPDTRVFTVADLARLWVWGTAHARDLPRIRKGQRAYVRADGVEEALDGTVDYVESSLGERTRTARARIVLSAPPNIWRPGMFVTAELVVAQVDAPVVVVEASIQRLGDHPVIFVEDQGRYEARPVELGRAGRDPEGRRVREIAVGLPQGARYVAGNAFVLKAELGKGSAGHEH